MLTLLVLKCNLFCNESQEDPHKQDETLIKDGLVPIARRKIAVSTVRFDGHSSRACKITNKTKI